MFPAQPCNAVVAQLLALLCLWLQLVRALKTVSIFDVRVVDYKARVFPFLEQLNVRRPLMDSIALLPSCAVTWFMMRSCAWHVIVLCFLR